MDICSHCGGPCVVWKYEACDGDLLFAGAFNVREGNGERQVRACLVCPQCDHVKLFPRYQQRKALGS